MKKPGSLNDNWFRFIGIPLLTATSHLVFFNPAHGFSDEGFSSWEVYLISTAEAMLLWETNRLVLIGFRNRYPHIHQSVRRILCQFAGCIAVTILARYLMIRWYDATLFWGYRFPPEGYLYNILVGLLYVVIVAGVCEGVYYFQKWKQLFAETALLKKENLQTQLDSLKVQINPHFLFNNLSSLTWLIMEDQGKAVTFVSELSSVYRYLLRSNEKDLTMLHEELSFIDDYFHLLKTRFGEGIRLTRDITESYLRYHLPPLTLQLLVENAVKHNTILSSRPLCIHLYTDGDANLIVENNIQQKYTLIVSGKLGLKNIAAKYRLLNGREVQVKQTAELFQVVVPLIKHSIHETINC